MEGWKLQTLEGLMSGRLEMVGIVVDWTIAGLEDWKIGRLDV